MQSVENSISSIAALALIDAAGARGLERLPLYQMAGLSPDARPEPDRQISALEYVELWDRVVQQLGDSTFAARTGMAFELEALEGFGFLAMSCATLAQAYQRTAGYRTLYNVGSTWELEPAGPRAMRMRWESWTLCDAPEAGRRAVNEYEIGEMLSSVKKLIAQPRLVPGRICFRHPAPSDPVALAPVFGIQPEFDADFDGFEVPRDVLTLPLAFSNSALRAYFERTCQDTMREFHSDRTLIGIVRRQIALGMNGHLPSMREVARTVGMSTRSLHRALDAEGTKFNALVDDVRHEFAVRLLSRARLSVAEVSYLVGFSDTSAFFKAFKRWTGKKPGEWRAALVT